MITDEKLKQRLIHFHEASIRNAQKKSDAAILEYKNGLEQRYEAYTADQIKKAEMDLKNDMDSIIRENNEKLSNAQIFIKTELNQKNKELTECIFDELLALVSEYKNTAEYKLLLVRQVNNVRTYAKWGQEQVIYIDRSDSFLKDELERLTNCTLSISDQSFLGGVRAVVNNNILIDNSFLSRIEELKENFNMLKYVEGFDCKNHGGGRNG